MQTWRAKFCIVQPISTYYFVKSLKSTIFETDFIFQKVFANKKNIDFFNFFSFIFCIVKIDYCFNVLPIYERFQIWFFHEFFIIFCQKESFFVKNWQFLIIFRIDNHFFAPNSWENVLWTFKYQFWETIFCDQNDILRAKNEKHNFFFHIVLKWMILFET